MEGSTQPDREAAEGPRRSGEPALRNRDCEAQAFVAALRRALYGNLRSLMQRFPFTDKEARATLRIELTHDRYSDMMQWAYSTLVFSLMRQNEHIGPMQFEGIDCYTVHNLPEPGWRIINPFGAWKA